MLELQSRNVPDLVIFYDGINDTSAAYQSGRSTHHNFDHIAAKVKKNESPPQLFVAWIESSNSFHLLKRLVAKLRQKPRNGTALVTYKTMGIDTASLSDLVVGRYISNYEIVDALAQKYGFKFVFFWQPVITIGDKSLTAEEQEMKRKMEPALIELYGSVYDRVQQVVKKYENLYYMAKIFDENEPLVWIDYAHVTPEGNRLIAQKMAQLIMDRNHDRIRN
jgi:lysophospholipase L1-like esterase